MAYIKCEICSENVRVQVFKSHLKKHGLTKEDYGKLYLGPNECKYCKKPTQLISCSKGYKDYCDECNSYNNVRQYQFWMIKKGMSEEEAKKKVSERQSQCSKDSFIKRYGEEEGSRRYKEFIAKSRTNSIDFYINKYGPELGPIKYAKRQQKRLESLEKLSDEEKKEIKRKQSEASIRRNQRERDNPGIYKPRSNRLEYWLNKGYDEKTAKEKLTERQRTFTLKKCIERFGEVEGRRIHKNRQDRWQETLKSKDDYEDIVRRRMVRFGVSKISQEFAWNLYEKLPDKLKKKTYFSELNKEFLKFDNGTVYLYDFVISNIKLCIEFHGRFWHPDPKEKHLWDQWKKPFIKSTPEEIYAHDLKKQKFLEDQGFLCLVVWDDEYTNDKELTINTLMEKIYERCCEINFTLQ